MTDLADFQTQVDFILASAIDSATWTGAIKEEALRQALLEYDEMIVYETSFTVTTTGYSQDLSGINQLKEILSVAYPWSDGADYQQYSRPYRYIADHTVYFETVQPQENDTIRVRHSKLHQIEDLDSATSTTVLARHERMVSLNAAVWCIIERVRQLSENPSQPAEAIPRLLQLKHQLEQELDRRYSQLPNESVLSWTAILR